MAYWNDLKQEAHMSEFIAGRNAVSEALQSGRSINKLFVQQGVTGGSIQEILHLARQKHIIIQEISASKLQTLVPDVKHQGVALSVAPIDYYELEDVLELAKSSGQAPFLLVLDEVQDPHNLGAILRSANAAGVHGVLIGKRRSCPLTQAVAKSSAGAIEYVPVVQMGNTAQTLEKLKSQGMWVVGADMIGECNYFEANLTGPIALVIGGEDRGLGRLVKEKCDLLIKIPMLGKISSLNASVACAILSFEVVRQRLSTR